MQSMATRSNKGHGAWWKSRWRWALGAIFVLALLTYALAPPLALRLANSRLAAMPTWTGHIDRFDLALQHGAVVLEDLRIWRKKTGSPEHPFLQVASIQLVAKWSDLLRGRVRFDAQVTAPSLHIVNTPGRKEMGQHLRDELLEAMGDHVRNMRIHKGGVQLTGQADGQPVLIGIHHLDATLTGLLDVASKAEPVPAHLVATADTKPDGYLRLDTHFDPRDPMQAFDVKAHFATQRLPDWNRLLARTADIHLDSGHLTVDLDLKDRDAVVHGTLRPYLSHLEIADWDPKNGGLVAHIKKALLGAAIEVLENKDTDVIAARISIHGRLDKPDVSAAGVVWTALKHAFAGSVAERRASIGLKHRRRS
jgi:hypothetical protein